MTFRVSVKRSCALAERERDFVIGIVSKHHAKQVAWRLALAYCEAYNATTSHCYVEDIKGHSIHDDNGKEYCRVVVEEEQVG